MITYSTKIENNQFKVTWDFSPKDVKCSRGNYTAIHKGGGSTSRRGIWEGVELVSAEVRVGNGPMTHHGTSTKVTVFTTDNNVEFVAVARYRLKTMGYHFQCTNGTYPFFYYGNIGGNPNRYAHGHFTDGAPKTPEQLFNIHAIVPKDWTHTGTAWSDWAYKNAEATPNWTCDPGRYEQRNGNYEGATSSNGWISDAGYKQAWRKSCLFSFDKIVTVSGVISNGIVKDASIPELSVEAIKGDSGKLTIKYIDKNNSNGKIKLKAYCKDKEIDILTYDQSQTFSNGMSKTLTIDFTDKFGESYRGNDITYQAWARNSHNKESAGTGKKGGHRFNGRPSIPNGLFVTGKNDIIYDDITLSWNKSIDAENDALTYDVHLKAINPNGVIARDRIIDSNINALKANLNISSYQDGTNFSLKVRAFDGLIYSNWSNTVDFKKGSKPIGSITLISPSKDDTNIYCSRPRFVFKGYDGQSIFVVNINNKEYDTVTNANMFTIQDNKIMFCINNITSNVSIYAYMKNSYGLSDKSAVYKFNYKTIDIDMDEGSVSTASVYNSLCSIINDKAKAYEIEFKLPILIAREDYIYADDYNKCISALKIINDSINLAIDTRDFDVIPSAVDIKPGVINDDALWKKIIQDIKNI